MSVITLFSGIFCNESAVIQHIVESTGQQLITDDMILASAAELSGIPPDKIKRAFSSRTSVFNQFTHEKECSIAYLRLAMARVMSHGNIMISGYSGLLIPKNIRHVLRICLIANTAFRISMAIKKQPLVEKEAARIIRLEDHDRSILTDTLFSQKDPWDAGLYDMVLPMGKTGPAKAAALIEENLLKEAVRPTDGSNAAVNDFLLAATAEVALVNAGHNVGVHAQKGRVYLTINKQVLMLSRLEEELKTIAEKVPGVVSVETLVDPSYPPSRVYRKRNRNVPSKVLLVDDEREFVQTLSERLQMRDMGSAVAYDGASALELVQNDEPDVMIIDLKMPGIDGMDILKEVKQTRPGIEVIVLTGHGSEQDKKTCIDLGAFAYMQKPVDINLLSDALKKAHEKIKASR